MSKIDNEYRLNIGQVAKETQVNIDTIRYYEKLGLLPIPNRNSSGYRQYSKNTILRLKFIKHGQELGFSLKEIKELLDLRTSSNTFTLQQCEDVQKKATLKLKEIENKINTLLKMKTVIQDLICACVEREDSEECPILRALEDDDGE